MDLGFEIGNELRMDIGCSISPREILPTGERTMKLFDPYNPIRLI